jgi:hypothetical protein
MIRLQFNGLKHATGFGSPVNTERPAQFVNLNGTTVTRHRQ